MTEVNKNRRRLYALKGLQILKTGWSIRQAFHINRKKTSAALESVGDGSHAVA